MWNPETNIRGLPGPPGADGADGVDGAPGPPGSTDWTGITGKPSTFPPDPEAVDDRVAALLVAGSNITLTYNDPANTLTIASTASGGSSVYVGTSPPVGAPDNSLWFESDTGLLYLRFNDGTSTQWVIVPPSVSAASIGAVAYTPQSPTASEQVQARKNLYAAPFDALAYNGMQINGSMEVNQQLGNNNATSASSTFPCDGWAVFKGGTMAFSSASSDIAPVPVGFRNIVYVMITTAQTSLGAGDYLNIGQNIEGTRTIRLAWGTPSASPITVAFWCQHTKAGTYTLGINNKDGSRSYCTTYTQNVANAAEYKTITIPGCTTGAWYIDNTTGIGLSFTLASGGTVTPTVDTWQNAFYQRAPGQVNGADSTSNAFRITGVVVLPGTEAPSAARSPLVMRPYGEELQICKRYFLSFPMNNRMMAVNGYTDNASSPVYFPVEMRTAPTVGALPWGDGNYNTAVGAGQWCLSRFGVVGATRTGTVVPGVFTWPDAATITFRGAVWSTVTTTLSNGPSGMAPLTFDARL